MCPNSVRSACPVSISHTFNVLSKLPETSTTRLPSAYGCSPGGAGSPPSSSSIPEAGLELATQLESGCSPALTSVGAIASKPGWFGGSARTALAASPPPLARSRSSISSFRLCTWPMCPKNWRTHVRRSRSQRRITPSSEAEKSILPGSMLGCVPAGGEHVRVKGEAYDAGRVALERADALPGAPVPDTQRRVHAAGDELGGVELEGTHGAGVAAEAEDLCT